MSNDKNLPIPPLLRRFWPVLLLLLLPLIPLGRALFSGEAIGPFDQIRQMAPWNGAKPAQAWDVLQADGVLQFYVWRDLVFDAWGKGQMPFWNSYQLAGTPLLADSQSGVLYPFHIAMGLLQVPTGLAMLLLAWFHLFWAGLGTYKLCRALGASKLGASIGGASFTLSTFMIAWTGLPSVIETVAWIPWILGFMVLIFVKHPIIERLDAIHEQFEADTPTAFAIKGFERSKRYPLLTLGMGASIGMMILAGHLQFVAYGFFALALTLIWLVASRFGIWTSVEITTQAVTTNGDVRGEPKTETGVLRQLANPVWGSTARVVVATIFGFCIAAPQLLAVLNYSQFSHRRNSPSDAGYEAYVSSAIQPYELVKMLIPTIQGNPRQVASDQLPISTYYPALLKPGANFAESALGIGAFGLLLLCLLPLLAKRKDPVWGVLLAGGIGLLLAIGTPLNKLLYYGVPGWSSTGSPGRAICLFVLAASVGAGLVVSRLGTLRDAFESNKQRIGIASGGFVLLCLVLFATKNNYELRKGLSSEVIDALKSQAESSALTGGLGILLLSVLAIGFSLKEGTYRSKAALLGVPILSSLAFFGATLVQTGKPDLAVKNDVGLERIAPINKTWDIFTAAHAALPPNLSSLNRIHSLDGYDSLLHRDTVAMLKDIDGVDPAPAVNGNMMFIKPEADIQKLADAGVTQVWSQVPIDRLGTGVQDSGLFKYKIPGPGRASTSKGPAKILSETPSQIKVQATGPGKLIVRERNMPGWLPKIDGKHATLGGTIWLEIDLPAGDHEIELNYVPPGFVTGLILAFIACLIAAVVAIRGILFHRSLMNHLKAAANGSK